MSVSKYIEEFNASVQESIQKNITRAEENPYPSEEIKQIRESDPESALAKMFDENGQIINPLGNQALLSAAIDQDKELYNRLRKGYRAKERLKNNEKLEALNAEEYLNNIYFKFKQELAKSSSLGTKIDVEELLDPINIDDFEDTADIGFNIDTSYVDIETIQSAFKEKNSSQIEESEGEESTAINVETIDEVTPTTEPEEIFENVEVLDEPVELNVESSNTLNIPSDEIEQDEDIIDQAPQPLSTEAESNLTNEEVLNQDPETGVSSFLSTILGGEASSTINQNEETNLENNIFNNIESPVSNFLGDQISSLENTSNIIDEGSENLTTIASDSFLSQILGSEVPSVSNITNESSEQDFFNSLSKNSSIENIGENVNNITKNTSFSSTPVSSIIPPSPVTKEDIAKVGDNISSTVSSGILSIPRQETASKEGTINAKSNKQENTSNSLPASVGSTGSSGEPRLVTDSDFSEMERRLKNIELLLQSPLEVKIKN